MGIETFEYSGNVPAKYESALNETKNQLGMLVEKIDPRTFVQIYLSSQRLGRVYAQTDTTSISPDYIQEEEYYAGLKHTGKSDIKENLNQLPRMQLAFEPFLSSFVELNWRKYTSIRKKMDEETMLDEARKITLDTLCWKLKTDEFSNPDKLTNLIIIRVLGYLKHLPARLNSDLSPTCSIDNLDESYINPLKITPEEALIRKESLISLLSEIEHLPIPLKILFNRIMSGEYVPPKEKNIAAQTISQLESLNSAYQNRKNVPDKSFKSKGKFGVVDNNGVSLFANLAPGQAFWLISNLTQKQRYAVFIKTGYLSQPPAEIGDNMPSLLNDAKESLISFRESVGNNNIPRFKGEITEMLKSAENIVHNYSSADETAIGKNFFKLKSFYLSSPVLADSFSGIKKDIIILIGDGKNVDEISNILNIPISRTYSKIWEINQKIQ